MSTLMNSCSRVVIKDCTINMQSTDDTFTAIGIEWNNQMISIYNCKLNDNSCSLNGTSIGIEVGCGSVRCGHGCVWPRAGGPAAARGFARSGLFVNGLYFGFFCFFFVSIFFI